MGTHTIGQVSERTGFSPSTLRYHEQHDLLHPGASADAAAIVDAWVGAAG